MLPPEIISGLIYSGAGTSSLMAAMQAWTSLAEQMEAQVLDTRAIVSGLDSAWQGPSASAMTAAVQRFSTWMEGTGSAARQSAQAAMGAATAYEGVFAGVVPPPVIASNRAQLLMLVASNLLGQNTSAIAALEAQYEAMWAQDTAAMNTYQADSSASVGQLPTFAPVPQVTNAAAAAPADAITDLEALLNGPIYQLFLTLLGYPIDIVQLFSSFFGPFLGSAIVAGEVAAQNSIIATKPSVPSVVYPPTSTGASASSVPKVTASVGTGNRLGPMRVPQSWAQPRQSPIASPITPGESKDRKGMPVGLPVIPAVPVMTNKSGQKKGTKFEDLDYGEPVAPILKRHPSGG